MRRNEAVLLGLMLASLIVPLGLTLFEIAPERTVLGLTLVGIPVVVSGFFLYHAVQYYR